MSLTILVTGASGVLGRRVATEAARRGHLVRTGSRSGPVDLATGTGLEEALAGVEVVLHCATDSGRHQEVDAAGTARLVAMTSAHVVYPGIVGSDVVPYPYYRSKLAAEEAVAAASGGYSLIRATQFHHLAWGWVRRRLRRPLLMVPNDTRVQVLDPGSLARRMVDAAESGPGGRLPDLGGHFAYEARDLATSALTAMGRRRPVVRINWPGILGASLRAGANLTANRDEEGETWNEFVARRIGVRSEAGR